MKKVTILVKVDDGAIVGITTDQYGHGVVASHDQNTKKIVINLDESILGKDFLSLRIESNLQPG